jgi:SagB-type dehydrogenase family enzyme
MADAQGGMLLEGGPSRQLLAGAASSTLLPRLLPCLDGSRSPAEVAAGLFLALPELEQAIRLLDRCGLIEWVPPDGPAGFAANHVADYMSRTISVTDNCPSAEDYAVELASVTVLLAAPPVLASLIAADLAETGVGRVLPVTAGQPVAQHGPVTGRCVAAVFDDPAEAELLAAAVTAWQEHELPVLRFSAAPGRVEVGPAFCVTETACVPCFRRGQERGEAHTDGSCWTAEAAEAELLASLVTSALLGMLAQQPPVPSPRRLVTTMIPAGVTEVRDVVPELECPSCSGGIPPRDPVARDLLAYEWRMAKVPAPFEPVSAPRPAERDWLLALQRQREAFAASPRHRLRGGDAVPGLADGSVGLAEPVLAAILARTAGFRDAADPRSRRWAPSGGNMASVAAYLCTEADLFGLPGTIYRYDDLKHQVISTRADPVPLGRILSGTDLKPAGTDIAIVLVGAAGRLSQKYGDFAWRLTHLDSGCAALQLSLVSASYGLPVTFASAWPAGLAELLELDPSREVVTAVAGLATAAGQSRKGVSPCR